MNKTDRPRVLSNTAVMLREPIRLARPDGCYTPIEQVTLDALGLERLDFALTRPRERLVSAREQRWAENAGRPVSET